MKLLIVRHSNAEDQLAFASSAEHDDLRPLTSKGRRRMKEVAEGLKLIEPKIDILATSPLTRAEQTAKIIAKIYGDMDVIQVPALAPGIGSTEIARWLSTQADDATLAIVAHEPDLSRLIGWLSNGQESSGVEMKKAAVCALQCPPSIEPGSCVMQWLLPPKLLRALRKL